MTDPQLLDYIRSQKAVSADDDSIRQGLLSSGWSNSDVDEAFAAIAPNAAGNNAAAPAPQPASNVNPAGPVIDDVSKSTKSYIFKNDKTLVFIYVVLVIASIVGVVYTRVPHLLIIPIFLGILGYGHVKSKIKREFTQQFGASIGFSYSAGADMSSVKGKLFNVGNSQKIYDVLSGTENGRSLRLFSYKFTVGGGKNSHTYYCTVFEAAFSNDMPDIVLSTKSSGTFGGLAGLNFFGGGERIQLEGDFNKYFTLSVPKGFETDAYEIFPPDVMADLIDKAEGLNFEFNGSKLYIYATYLITNREKLQAVFDLAKYLDNLFAMSTRAVDVAQPAA